MLPCRCRLHQSNHPRRAVLRLDWITAHGCTAHEGEEQFGEARGRNGNIQRVGLLTLCGFLPRPPQFVRFLVPGFMPATKISQRTGGRARLARRMRCNTSARTVLAHVVERGDRALHYHHYRPMRNDGDEVFRSADATAGDHAGHSARKRAKSAGKARSGFTSALFRVWGFEFAGRLASTPIITTTEWSLHSHDGSRTLRAVSLTLALPFKLKCGSRTSDNEYWPTDENYSVWW